MELLTEILSKVNKKAFVASPQTQQSVAEAQQQGLIQPPPPPSPGSEEQPQIGFNEIAQLVQGGLQQLSELQQQTMQMVQQIGMELQAMKMGGKGGDKKKSVQERLDQIEQMMAQITSGVDPQQQEAAQQQATSPDQQQASEQQAPQQ